MQAIPEKLRDLISIRVKDETQVGIKNETATSRF